MFWLIYNLGDCIRTCVNIYILHVLALCENMWEFCFCSPVFLILGPGTGRFQSDNYKASGILMASTSFSCHFRKQHLVCRHWSTFENILGPREMWKMYKLPRRHGGGCSRMQHKSHFCPFRKQYLMTLYPWPRLTPTSAAWIIGIVQVENVQNTSKGFLFKVIFLICYIVIEH